MSNPDSYVKEIKSLEVEIKHLNKRSKFLRDQQRQKKDLLYNYMNVNELKIYKEITIKSIYPRSILLKRKPESAKKEDAIVLFREAGINDPERFYSEFKATQKYIPNKEKKKEKYDPFLSL